MKQILALLIVPILQFLRRIRYLFIFKSFKDFTMIPWKIYVANLELCRHFIHVPGSIVECGTWRGGMIAGISKLMGEGRMYYLFDSFEGLPPVTTIDGTQAKKWQQDKNSSDYFNNCTASESEALKAIKKSVIPNYEMHKGWFNQTLPGLKIQEGIAILRLDGDWYDSTMDCLVHLFPQVNNRGLIIIDDYFRWEGCSKAVHDYLSSLKSPCVINVHKEVCYIVKV